MIAISSLRQRAAFPSYRLACIASTWVFVVLLSGSNAQACLCCPEDPCCPNICAQDCPDAICYSYCQQYDPCACCALGDNPYCCDDKGTPETSDDICVGKCGEQNDGGCHWPGMSCCDKEAYYTESQGCCDSFFDGEVFQYEVYDLATEGCCHWWYLACDELWVEGGVYDLATEGCCVNGIYDLATGSMITPTCLGKCCHAYTYDVGDPSLQTGCVHTTQENCPEHNIAVEPIPHVTAVRLFSS